MPGPAQGHGGAGRGRPGVPDAVSPWSSARPTPPSPPPAAAHANDRPETIEDTADLVTAAGGHGIAVAVDHLDTSAVRALVERIDREQGRLDLLVNDICGGEKLFEWDTPVWEHDLDNGLRLLRLGVETHAITSHFALPLLLRRPDGRRYLAEVQDAGKSAAVTGYR